MGPTVDDPTEIFLRYLAGADDEGRPRSSSSVATSDQPSPPAVSIDDLDGAQQSEHLVSLFAALAFECRRADITTAELLVDRITEFAGSDLPELDELARSVVAHARGDHRQAESLLTSCLRRPHTYEKISRQVALLSRATERMLLGLLDAALSDLDEAEQFGPSLLGLHGLAIKTLIHWWRGDEAQAIEALEQGPHHLVKGLDLGVGWYALAAEHVKNGRLFAEDLDDGVCLARDFWDARIPNSAPDLLSILGPHMIRHEIAAGNDPQPLLDELRGAAVPDTGSGHAFQWCVALADGDVDQLADIADRHRDGGTLLSAIEAYRDAARHATTPESQERFSRRSRLIYERLSRAINVKSQTDLPELPESLARSLTDAERNVVAAAAQGLTNREAAALLNCSVRTVESHLTSSYRKLGIKRRTQLPVLIAQAKMDS